MVTNISPCEQLGTAVISTEFGQSIRFNNYATIHRACDDPAFRYDLCIPFGTIRREVSREGLGGVAVGG
jgi:hypothetical protein